MKRCPSCGQSKAENAFSIDRRKSDGLDSYCRECKKQKRQAVPRARQQAYQNRWRAKNADRVREKERADYTANPERFKARQDRYRAKHPERVSARRREMTLAGHGLTPEDFEAMMIAQEGRCAICGSEDPKHWSGKFSIDHDHQTMVVRGLLCSECNRGMGHFGDDADRLFAAANYLKRFNTS
jgi:hypothetical protein